MSEKISEEMREFAPDASLEERVGALQEATSLARKRLDLAALILRKSKGLPGAMTGTALGVAYASAGPHIAQWLETEAKGSADDEDHSVCTPETCTFVAALPVAVLIVAGSQGVVVR